MPSESSTTSPSFTSSRLNPPLSCTQTGRRMGGGGGGGGGGGVSMCVKDRGREVISVCMDRTGGEVIRVF